jgi:hypothetical protein
MPLNKAFTVVIITSRVFSLGLLFLFGWQADRIYAADNICTDDSIDSKAQNTFEWARDSFIEFG